MEKEKVLVPIYYCNGKKICTTITASICMVSQGNVQLAYGNHSKPTIIEIRKIDANKTWKKERTSAFSAEAM